MKKILVPTDFSPLASYALDAALQLAQKTNAEVILLHVVEVPGASFSITGQAQDPSEFDLYTMKLISKTKADLADILNKHVGKKVKLTSSLHVGNAYHEIASVITDQQVDLVIMGSKGAEGWEEALVGSNAEKVVRRSECPVLVIKREFDMDKTMTMVFAAEFNDESRAILKVKELQKILGANLHLLKVNTPANFVADHVRKQVMKKFALQHELENCTLNVYNEKNEEDGILHFAEEIDADLITLGTHGRTGIYHLLNGSIAEDVVNHSKRPVWTCKIS